MSKTMQEQELDNLINMLERDLEKYREGTMQDYNYDAIHHKYTRMFFTLAQECRELRGIIEQAGLSSQEGNDAK